MIDLSVIIPAYNCENYIGRCLDSILRQNGLEIEIIIVNDGSVDNTENICKTYEEKYKNIRIINKKNEGQGIARNIGVKESKGKYITFVDSDDYVKADCYKLAISLMDENNADLFVGQIKKITHFVNLSFTENLNNVNYYLYDMNKKDLVKSLLTGNEISDGFRFSSSTCDKVYKKDLIQRYEINFLSEREYLSEDMLFNVMYLNFSSKCILSNLQYYNYVTNITSYCHTYQINYVEKMHKMLDKLRLYKFNYSTEEYEILVATKIYGYIKSYYFQEIEHNSLINTQINIKKLVQKEYIKEIFRTLKMKDLRIVDKFILLFSKREFGFILAIVYKMKYFIFRTKNKI